MKIKNQIADIAEPVVEELGYELVDVEYLKEGEGWVCRVFVDHPSGIGLDDCENISKHLSKILDEKDIIPHRYVLEVSSPGLDRPLKKEEDFERFREHSIVVKTYKSFKGKKKNEGVLKGLEDSSIILKRFEDGSEVSIPVEIVSSVRLLPEL